MIGIIGKAELLIIILSIISNQSRILIQNYLFACACTCRTGTEEVKFITAPEILAPPLVSCVYICLISHNAQPSSTALDQ